MSGTVKKIVPVGAERKTPRHRSLVVDLLIMLFGVSSWVAVNGLFVELPVLVNVLPESWELSSYVLVTSQLANLGLVLFNAARKFWSQKVLEVPMIHTSLAIVISSCVLMSIFWDSTTYIAGELHSTALLILTFFLSLVDCTSSVLYLPFIANFKEQYVISYLLGTALSSPLPAMLALAQGVGGSADCRNVSVTELGNVTDYVMEAYYPPPHFSPNIYFAILSVQMVLSWIAFILLNNLAVAKKERVHLMPVTEPKISALDENFQSSIQRDFSIETASSEQNLLGKPNITSAQYLLLGIQGVLCTIYGFLLSVQTYSCLPYGGSPYHLAVALSTVAGLLSCLAAMFLPVPTVRVVTGLSVAGCCWAAYILTTALLSPFPPLVGTTFGAFLVVLSWVIISGKVGFVKASIAVILRREGGQAALYRYGVVTQIGSCIGAIVPFILIQYADLFHSYTPCS